MPELTILLDARIGTLFMEHPDRLPTDVQDTVTRLLGSGVELGCARPRVLLPPPGESEAEDADMAPLRIAGYYHDSLVEGPGRRSSVLVSGCTLGCPGCWVPHLHPSDSGIGVAVDRLADALLDPAHTRDGVSVLGGEPFQQPEGLLGLVRALRDRGCRHVLAYSGYTYEGLRRLTVRQPAIGAVLDEIQLLIDGPYVEALAAGAGPWTGSTNQRVIDLVATRRAGQVIRFKV